MGVSGLDIEGTLSAHEPAVGLFAGVPGIVGCSCLSARDYRAAGFKAGQAGYRAHVAAVLRAQVDGALAEAWSKGYVALAEDLDLIAGMPADRTPNPYRAAHLSDTERAGGAE